MRETEQHN